MGNDGDLQAPITYEGIRGIRREESADLKERSKNQSAVFNSLSSKISKVLEKYGEGLTSSPSHGKKKR